MSSRVMQLRDTVRAASASDHYLASLVGPAALPHAKAVAAATAATAAAAAADADATQMAPAPAPAAATAGTSTGASGAHAATTTSACQHPPPRSLATRPASAGDCLGISALRRAGIATMPPANAQPSQDQACSSSFAPSAYVPVHAVEPDLQWYEGHFFYARKVTNFFMNTANILSRTKTFSGNLASETQELKDRIERKETPNAMKTFHSSLLPKVNPTGLILISDVLEFYRSSLPPMQQAAAEETLTRFVAGGKCGPVTDDVCIPYVTATLALENLLTGTDRDEVMKACFTLCDPGRTGYILKSTLRALPGSELAPPPLPPVVSSSSSSGTAADQAMNPEFNYLIAQALWRAFASIAKKEEENAANSKGKKGKKGGGKKGAGPAAGGMKQFHINYHEFVTAVDTDPYVAASFFPYMIKIEPTLPSQRGQASPSQPPAPAQPRPPVEKP